MADKVVTVTNDPVKARLSALKARPVLTPAEVKEAIEKILDHLEIK